MDRVSDKRLAYLLGHVEIRWPFMGPDEIESVLRELQERRAAEREQAEEPSGWAGRLLEAWQKERERIKTHSENLDGCDDRAVRLIDDFCDDLRSAEREQAAPPKPRLAKWERQLREMGGTVEYNRDTGQYEATGEGVKWYCADTAKAAVKAAWKAWREARDEH